MDIKRPPKWRRWLKRVALIGSVALFAAGGSGFVFQHARDAWTRAAHPAPGSFVDVDGHRMHYRTRGEGRITFVLEPGLGDYSGNWGELEEELAKWGQVFVYDRAGLGWSEACSRPRNPGQIVSELHEVLARAKIPPPYLLVGHSLGGLTQTLYAVRYPKEVAGLFLIEPGQRDQWKVLPRPGGPLFFTMMQVSRVAGFGLPQLLMQNPDPIANQAKHVRASGAELRAVMTANAGWSGEPFELGRTPIYVITSGDYRRFPGKTEGERRATWERWSALHERLVAASSSSIQRHIVVKGASHYVHRANLPAVVAAVREMMAKLEAESG